MKVRRFSSTGARNRDASPKSMPMDFGNLRGLWLLSLVTQLSD